MSAVAGVAPTVPVDTPYFLSLAERDRRHAAIRQAMAALGLDALVLPASTNRWEQSMADSRYVTGIGGFGTETLVVFPLEGEPTVFLFNRAAWWQARQEWVSDVRDGLNHWGANAAARLKELRLEAGNIGITQLEGRSRTPDGSVPAGTMKMLAEELPRARFVDATDILLSLRSVKSPEEIAVLAQAGKITEKMVGNLRSAGLRGMAEREAYAELTRTMLAEGGELPALMIIGSGPPSPGTGFVPSSRRLDEGDLLVGEFEARIAGYGAQIVSPVSVGGCRDEYLAIHRVAADAFAQFLPCLRAGQKIGSLVQQYEDCLREVGGAKCVADAPSMHARGLGDDAPMLLRRDNFVRHEADCLAQGMVLILKPIVWNADRTLHAQVGRIVEVREDGGVALNDGLGLDVLVSP